MAHSRVRNPADREVRLREGYRLRPLASLRATIVKTWSADKEEAIEVVESTKCGIRAYQFLCNMLGLAVTNTNGRYSDEGRVCNELSDETWTVVAGQSAVHHEEVDFNIREGDGFLFPKKKCYWAEATDLRIVASTWPPCTPDQHKPLP